MASLKISDSAFGDLGVTIVEAIDLQLISQQLSSLLGMTYQYDSLDVSEVTRPGLSVQGLGLAGSVVTVGSFGLFDPQAPVTGFSALGLSANTIAAQGLSYAIRAADILANEEETVLSFDAALNTVDFSGTGTAPIEVSVTETGQFDDPGSDFPYRGFQVIGNAGDNLFYGNHISNQSYYGSDAFFAGEGNDTIHGGFGSELLEGGAGDDLLFGDQGDDLLLGHLQGDASGAGEDVLYGGAGFDELVAGAGNDALFAGEDNDTLTGGAGRDRFYAVENYDIPTGQVIFDIEAGPLPVFVTTGESIADSADFQNTVTDFVAGTDTLVLAIDDSLAQVGSAVEFEQVNVDGASGRELTFTVSDNGVPVDEVALLDTQAAVTAGDVLVQVLQSDLVLDQDLDHELSFPMNNGFEALSFEVRYTEASQSNALDGIDRFEALQVELPGAAQAGPHAGQDKFDLRALEVDFGPEAIEDILFSTGEDYGSFIFEDFEEGDPPLEDFFFDAEAGVDRALHVEAIDYYNAGSATAIAAYVDADGNGDYDAGTDLTFIVESLLDDEGSFYGEFNPLTAQDLYNDSGDGSGTGIFIFNDEQNDLWFNDLPPEPQP